MNFFFEKCCCIRHMVTSLEKFVIVQLAIFMLKKLECWMTVFSIDGIWVKNNKPKKANRPAPLIRIASLTLDAQEEKMPFKFLILREF